MTQTTTPTITGYTRWRTEAAELIDALHHGTNIIAETRSTIWEQPTGERPEIPGRVAVGEISDPTGDTAVDPRRIALATAITRLGRDPQRARLQLGLYQKTTTTLELHGHNPLEPYNDWSQSDWPTTQARTLEAIAATQTHHTQLTDRALTQLAHTTRQLNNHLNQQLRRAALAFNHYNQNHQ